MILINKIVDYPSCTIIWDEVWKIPEFKKLQTTEQNPYWHGEIYVSRHIEQVVNEIYKLCPIETSDVFMSVGDGSVRWQIGIKGEKPKGTKKQEDEVTEIQNERIFKYARQKQSFIIDATNLKLMYRDKFRQMLYPYKPKIVYVYIEAPTYNETLTRRKGQIPKDVINKMRESFEFPKLYECDELIIEKQCNNISID